MLKIFKNNLNIKNSIIKNVKVNKIRNKLKYFPPYTKEWKNSIYMYYKYNMSNLPIYSSSINKLITNYFNLYFDINSLFMSVKSLRRKRRAFLIKKIYLSKVDVKYTNKKAMITIFTYNVRKNFYYKKYIINHIYICSLIAKRYSGLLLNLIGYETKYFFKLKKLQSFSKKNIVILKYNLLYNLIKIIYLFVEEYNYFLDKKKSITLLGNKLSIYKYIKYNRCLINRYRKYEYKYLLNKYKFEKNKLLPILTKLLSKFLNKKIEYNLINLKSITYSPSIFTKLISLRVRKREIVGQIDRWMSTTLTLFKFGEDKNQGEVKMFNEEELLNNRRKKRLVYNLSLRNIFVKNRKFKIEKLNNLLIAKRLNREISERNVFNKIEYKRIGGGRLEVKGRTTLRYRADRSRYSYRIIGGLRNKMTSYKRVPLLMYRGNVAFNIMYNSVNDKRRLGAFSVKGWLSVR